MLTTLVVEGQTYYPLSLLAMLQQAWPGVEKPAGDGTLATPWQPKTPAQWFYCSKEKPKIVTSSTPSPDRKSTTTTSARVVQRFWADSTNKAWVIVGGRLISIDITNFYASDHGPAPTVKDSPGSTGLTASPAVVYKDAAYSAIYRKLNNDYESIKDKTLAQTIRKLLKGESLGAESTILPLLTAVWFISEPARNHTAFHTGLMILDLVEQGIKIGSGASFAYTMQNVLWNTGLIESVGSREGMSENTPTGIRPYTTTAPVTEKVGYDKRARRPILRTRNVVTDQGVVLSGGGESNLPGGIAAMAHDHSAHGGAYDLTGTGEYRGASGGTRVFTPARGMHSTALTIVRRKEATILIRWLACALKKKFNLAATVGSGDVSYSDNVVAAAYSGVEAMVGKEANKILQLCQERVQSFDLMIDGPEADAVPIVPKPVVQPPVQENKAPVGKTTTTTPSWSKIASGTK
jgi:hypothetical protein